MTDLVERLRSWAGADLIDGDVLVEAADALEAAQAQAAEVRRETVEALRPLGHMAHDYEWSDVGDEEEATLVYQSEAGGEETICVFKFREIRRAAAAIRGLTDAAKGDRT